MSKLLSLIISIPILITFGCTKPNSPEQLTPNQTESPIIIYKTTDKFNLPDPKQPIIDLIHGLGEYNVRAKRDTNETTQILTDIYKTLSSTDKPPLAEFIDTYKNIQYLRTHKLDQTSPNTFTGIFEFFNIDQTGDLYQIDFTIDQNNKVIITDNRLLPLPHIAEQLTLQNGQSAQILILDNNRRQVRLNDTTIQIIDPNTDFLAATFNVHQLSQTTHPNYFTYQKYGWEQSTLTFVNINTSQIALEIPTPALAQFNLNQTLLVTCAPQEQTEGFIKLFQIPEFTEYLPPKLPPNTYIKECTNFDPKTETLHYTTIPLDSTVNPPPLTKQTLKIPSKP